MVGVLFGVFVFVSCFCVLHLQKGRRVFVLHDGMKYALHMIGRQIQYSGSDALNAPFYLFLSSEIDQLVICARLCFFRILW